jgi:hypothetical protein
MQNQKRYNVNADRDKVRKVADGRLVTTVSCEKYRNQNTSSTGLTIRLGEGDGGESSWAVCLFSIFQLTQEGRLISPCVARFDTAVVLTALSGPSPIR